MKIFTKSFFIVLAFLCFSSMAIAQKSASIIQKQPTTTPSSLKKIDPELLNLITPSQVVSSDMAQSNEKNASRKIVVNILCRLSTNLFNTITNAGGTIISSSAENNNIVAMIPMASLEQIANSSEVKNISKSSIESDSQSFKLHKIEAAKFISDKNKQSL